MADKGDVRLWGAKPGEDGRNEGRWKRVSPGDYLLLFVHGGGKVTVAEVSYTFRNEALARSLWGETNTANGTRQTWEFMFSLLEPRDLVMPTPTLNVLIGRKPNASVQEFVVLALEPSAAVVDFLDLPDSPANPTVQVPATPVGRKLVTRETPDREFDELDEQAIVLRRKEQAYLRKYILPGNSGICALCERVLPIEFLVAAHIKRRSECSDGEKQDFENIAMPNCKPGCDELFGRGLIGVSSEGYVEVSSKAPDVGAVAVYLETHLVGRHLDFWTSHPASRKYFEHHHLKDFRK
ncbi:hypothetical protein [Pseudarthrobacter sp. NamE5]|uniref:hypothetical protein n=1 Tax=Pseudarthrobacter sp. NamE5 TaxID=2576839 RepID=UPI00110B30A9|nr:hypothetical protein [Pseudarthrobacter sp. NamE5]TLM80932.1 hypothetical protein FDW84_19090 [Pseudarthrobacter sp. NamE5]